MFGLRSDGRKIKSLDPLFRVIPHVMKERSDAHVYFSQEIPIKTLDEYIAKKDQEGIKMSYMNIIYAALVRMLAEKPALNRFIMDGRTYARHGIHISLAIKKGMTEKATRGQYQASPPFGYSIENGVLHIIEDEANIVKIKINIYNICSTVYQVFESRGNDCSKAYIAKLDDFKKNWETSLAKAREHEDVEQALIEEIKLETLEKIKKSYYNYCK